MSERFSNQLRAGVPEGAAMSNPFDGLFIQLRRPVIPKSLRERVFRVRFDFDEWDRLRLVAAHHSLTPSAIVRQLVKHEHDTIREAERALDGLDQKDRDLIHALSVVPKDVEELRLELMVAGYRIGSISRWLKGRLEKLSRLDYVNKTRHGYVLEAKGRAARAGLIKEKRRRLRVM